MLLTDSLKPQLKTPFPSDTEFWKCTKTGLIVPKGKDANVQWRTELLKEAETDMILQSDLMSACRDSQLFWINAFGWTYHQFDVDPNTGERYESPEPYVPFITWDVQDELCNEFEAALKAARDILVDKCRDMGASWLCVFFMHWLWLFRKGGPQLLEMSRTQEYVDQTGNMKALFQKHDVINNWLPDWMCPPEVLVGENNRTKMHMKNTVTGACLDGESTTEHAASGDRRLVALMDEFSKVKFGRKMRSATKDVALMRIINSTPAGAGTEYSRWKRDGTIKVFQLPFWEHPEKGAGRYVQSKEDGGFEIRSPWFNHEETVRSPKELAQEVLMQDIESGDVFFTLSNFTKHKAAYVSEPLQRFNISLDPKIPEDDIKHYIKRKDFKAVKLHHANKGKLKVWTHLIMGRPDQSKSYQFGIDISKGQGASNSVISIRCIETGEKIAVWECANTPPYDMAKVAVALALWCGGALPNRLPFMKWEMNGPGWDFGKQIVHVYEYPYYYKKKSEGNVVDKVQTKYGWHASSASKEALLYYYDRVMAHGGYINHCAQALEEAFYYIHFAGGKVGPAQLVEESDTARKTHGDRVMADALSLDDCGEFALASKSKPTTAPKGSFEYRKKQYLNRNKRKTGYRQKFDFRD